MVLDIGALSMLGLIISAVAAGDAPGGLATNNLVVMAAGVALLFLVKPFLWFVIQRDLYYTLADNERRLGQDLQWKKFEVRPDHSSPELSTQTTFALSTGANLLAQRIPVTFSGVLSDGVALLGLAIFALIATPLQTIVALFSFGLLGIGAHTTLARRAESEGQQFLNYTVKLADRISETQRGLVEIRAYGRMPYFLRRIDYARDLSATSSARLGLLSSLPRQFFDSGFILIVGLVAGVTYLLQGQEGTLSSIALFAAVSSRLAAQMLSLQSNLQLLRQGIGESQHSLVIADSAYERASRRDSSSAGFGGEQDRYQSEQQTFALYRELDSPPMISASSLSYSYPGPDGAKLSFEGLSIQPGTLTLIKGSSGAGKSTLLRLLAGEIKPTEGQIRYIVSDKEYDPSERLTGRSFLPQDFLIFPESAMRNIDFGFRPDDFDSEATSRIYARYLLHFAESHSVSHLGRLNDLDATKALDSVLATDLSGGERQRIALARTEYNKGRLILLDEPTSSLDADNRATIAHSIAQLRGLSTLVITSHTGEFEPYADLILTIEDGQLSIFPKSQ